jgi:hypothetical protein
MKDKEMYTQETSHMYWRLQRYPADGKRQHIRRMSMHNGIDIGKLLKYLAVYTTFRKSLGCILLYRFCILNLVFDYIICILHQGWREVSGHVEVGMVIRVSDTDVAVGVEDAMFVENVGGSYEAPVLGIRLVLILRRLRFMLRPNTYKVLDILPIKSVLMFRATENSLTSFSRFPKYPVDMVLIKRGIGTAGKY